MSTATIQFSQGALIGGAGKSLLNILPNIAVTLTDAGGAGAAYELWECFSFPGPLASAPIITNPTSQVATFTPTIDGLYIFKLTRVEGGVVTWDHKFCGVPNTNGDYIPSSGITGKMCKIDPNFALAEIAGWMGRADALTNVLLDSILRKLIGATSLSGMSAAAVADRQVVSWDNVGVIPFDGTETLANAIAGVAIGAHGINTIVPYQAIGRIGNLAGGLQGLPAWAKDDGTFTVWAGLTIGKYTKRMGIWVSANDVDLQIAQYPTMVTG